MALLYPEECYKINGALFEVHKELGPGLLEKVYQEALEKELELQGIPFEREKSFTIMYKGEALERSTDNARTNSKILTSKHTEEANNN